VTIQERILERLPAGVRAHPLETSLTILGVPAGITLLLRVANSNALNVLPGPVLTVWSLVWTVGCVSWFIGLVFSDKKETGSGIVVKHVPALLMGLWFVSVTSLVYGVAVLVSAGWNGVLASVTPLCIAGGTYIRRIDLQRRIKDERE
jgi:hypothetical protein